VSAKRRGVVLDRDGTLIDFHRDEELGAVVSAFHPSQLRILPGVVEGLRALADAGFVLAIATNQPGAAKGQVSRVAIERTNAALVTMLTDLGAPIAEVAVCFHHPDISQAGDASLQTACACRKPAPGLVLGLAELLNLDASSSWMVGDSVVDVAAGKAAGLRTALLWDANRCQVCPLRDRAPADVDLVGPTLAGLAPAIVAASARA
jgi:D-glycero-D-manno-heptose 1,7-bisphosphate phosphatase